MQLLLFYTCFRFLQFQFLFSTAFFMPIVKGFPRFHSNSRQAISEISNLVAGSNVDQSERSSDAPITCKKTIRKKVTSDDRRAMLESYVNKYRAMNLGKFPSPTSAHKEIGGSYYVIRKMLQEMEYDFKKTHVEEEPTDENKKQIKSGDTINREITVESSESQEKSNSQITTDQQLCENPLLESVSNLDTNVKLKEEIQPSTSSADCGNKNIIRDEINNIVTNNHDRVVVDQFDEKLEQNLKDDNSSLEDSESKVEKQDDEIRDIARDTPEQQKQSLWGNLKSLATGFINIWRK